MNRNDNFIMLMFTISIGLFGLSLFLPGDKPIEIETLKELERVESKHTDLLLKYDNLSQTYSKFKHDYWKLQNDHNNMVNFLRYRNSKDLVDFENLHNEFFKPEEKPETMSKPESWEDERIGGTS